MKTYGHRFNVHLFWFISIERDSNNFDDFSFVFFLLYFYFIFMIRLREICSFVFLLYKRISLEKDWWAISYSNYDFIQNIYFEKVRHYQASRLAIDLLLLVIADVLFNTVVLVGKMKNTNILYQKRKKQEK